ncbi:MAG: DUF1922 domain-containing protein [Candidatus Asgardarchaeia archaeon]
MSVTKRYIVLRCPYCGNATYGKYGIKTRRCPYCGKRFKVSTYTVIGSFKDPFEASQYVREYNYRKHEESEEKGKGNQHSVVDDNMLY